MTSVRVRQIIVELLLDGNTFEHRLCVRVILVGCLIRVGLGVGRAIERGAIFRNEPVLLFRRSMKEVITRRDNEVEFVRPGAEAMARRPCLDPRGQSSDVAVGKTIRERCIGLGG